MNEQPAEGKTLTFTEKWMLFFEAPITKFYLSLVRKHRTC